MPKNPDPSEAIIGGLATTGSSTVRTGAEGSASTSAPTGPDEVRVTITAEVAEGPKVAVLTASEFMDKLSVALALATGEVRAVLDETILGLLRSRDFLGLQLNHEWGNITDGAFRELADRYLETKESGPEAGLERKIAILLANVSADLDAEVIADIFNRPLAEVELIIKRLLSPTGGAPIANG